MQLAGVDRLALRLGSQAGVDQTIVKPDRLFRGFERNGEFRRTGGAKIVGHAADGDNQRAIGNAAGRRDLPSLFVKSRPEPDDFGRAVEPDHLAEVVAEMVPMALGEIIELVL